MRKKGVAWGVLLILVLCPAVSFRFEENEALW